MVGEVLLTKTKDRKIRLGKKSYQEKKNVPRPIVIKLHIFTMYNRCSENVIDNLFKVQFNIPYKKPFEASEASFKCRYTGKLLWTFEADFHENTSFDGLVNET